MKGYNKKDNAKEMRNTCLNLDIIRGDKTLLYEPLFDFSHYFYLINPSNKQCDFYMQILTGTLHMRLT